MAVSLVSWDLKGSQTIVKVRRLAPSLLGFDGSQPVCIKILFRKQVEVGLRGFKYCN
jgi:hypothetical protein